MRYTALASPQNVWANPRWRMPSRTRRRNILVRLNFAGGDGSAEALSLESTSMKKALDHLKKSDVILASIIARVGPCKMTYREPSFEALARAIVFQQLSTKAARTIYGRLEEAAGGGMTPESIQNLSVGEMRPARACPPKGGYIRAPAGHAPAAEEHIYQHPSRSD